MSDGKEGIVWVSGEPYTVVGGIRSERKEPGDSQLSSDQVDEIVWSYIEEARSRRVDGFETAEMIAERNKVLPDSDWYLHAEYDDGIPGALRAKMRLEAIERQEERRRGR